MSGRRRPRLPCGAGRQSPPTSCGRGSCCAASRCVGHGRALCASVPFKAAAAGNSSRKVVLLVGMVCPAKTIKTKGVYKWIWTSEFGKSPHFFFAHISGLSLGLELRFRPAHLRHIFTHSCTFLPCISRSYCIFCVNLPMASGNNICFESAPRIMLRGCS